MKWTEITGVDKNVDFKVKGLDETYRIVEQPTGFQRIAVVIPGGELIGASTWVYDEIMYAAPSGIIHLPPPLTDEQREQLGALFTIGYPYLAKDKDETVYAYETRPHKVCKAWHYENGDSYMLCTKQTLCLRSLVAYSDPEPFDIGKALGVGE